MRLQNALQSRANFEEERPKPPLENKRKYYKNKKKTEKKITTEKKERKNAQPSLSSMRTILYETIFYCRLRATKTTNGGNDKENI